MSARTTFEDALQAWIAAATGYDAENVVWRDGKSDRPSGAFVELRLGALRPIGQDWVTVAANPAATPPEGEEYISTVYGNRTTELRLEAFNGEATGDDSPDEALALCITAAKLPSIRGALNRAGVGIASFEAVQTLDGVLGASGAEPRALLTVHLHLTATAQEFASYIGTVEFQHVDADGDPLADVVVVTES